MDSGHIGYLKPEDYSDSGNAEVFVRTYKDDLLYSDAMGWMRWNGKFWERAEHDVLNMASQLSKDMLEDAKNYKRRASAYKLEVDLVEVDGSATETEIKEAKELYKDACAYLNHAGKTRDARKLQAMLKLATPSLYVPEDKFDWNPAIINTPIGIINLPTAEVSAHKRECYCTKITTASPSASGAEMWENFLSKITCGDDGLRGFLQIMAGMTLYGKVYEEGMIIAVGAGRNGKSTFFNALSAALGDYAGGIDVQVFTTDKQNRGAALATLRGKRLVIAGELEEGKRLSVATVKQITSTDNFVIEEKYKAPTTVSPSHTVVLHTNHKPRVGSTDDGTWRRLKIVPFNARIAPNEGVTNYGDRLLQEAGGAILAWALQGAVDFARNRYELTIPDAVAECTEEYRAAEDWLSNFISECCVRDPAGRVGASEIYSRYREWAAACGDSMRRQSDFNVAMEAAGFIKTTPKNRKTWNGIRIDHSARMVAGY